MRDSGIAPVIVGADGSRSSRNAIGIAARHAALSGRPLRIIHAFNWIPTMRADDLLRVRDMAEEIVDEAHRLALGAAPGVCVSVHLREGPATTILLREARSAALLVIGDGGLNACTCLNAECGAAQLAARAPCTVLVTRNKACTGGPIVVGVDCSTAGTGVLDFALTTAATTGAPLVVVQVAEPPADTCGADLPPTDLVDELERRACEYAAAEVRRCSGDPADVLLRESAHAGLLVVGPRGERLGRGLLGPVAQTLLHHSAAPVAIVRRPRTAAPAVGATSTTIRLPAGPDQRASAPRARRIARDTLLT